MYARIIHSTVMMNLERSWVMFLLMKSYLLGADRFDIELFRTKSTLRCQGDMITK